MATAKAGRATRHVKSVNRTSQPTIVENIAPVKGKFGTKRISDLEKAVKNRNRRIRYQVKRLAGEFTPENYAKLARSGYLPSALKVDFSQVKTVADYNLLMKMLTADKTKQWKGMRLDAMRNWMKAMVQKGAYVDRRMDSELYDFIDHMSELDILRFREENKDLVSDVFEWYAEPYIDLDERNWLWDSIRKSLGLPPVEDKPLMFAM